MKEKEDDYFIAEYDEKNYRVAQISKEGITISFLSLNDFEALYGKYLTKRLNQEYHTKIITDIKDDDLGNRKLLKMQADYKLDETTRIRFLAYMRLRWGSPGEEYEKCVFGYAKEWVERFKHGREYQCSDSEGKKVLERIDTSDLMILKEII